MRWVHPRATARGSTSGDRRPLLLECELGLVRHVLMAHEMIQQAVRDVVREVAASHMNVPVLAQTLMLSLEATQ